MCDYLVHYKLKSGIKGINKLSFSIATASYGRIISVSSILCVACALNAKNFLIVILYAENILHLL